MRINEEKTEVMLISKEEEEMNIRVRDQELKQVDQFKYLGVCFGAGNVINIELNSRIEKFNNTLRLLYPLIRDRNVPRKVKIAVYVSILRPILTYGCEAWALTTKTKSKIQACEMRVLRSIKGCLLYTSDAADERSSVDLGGRRIIKKKTKTKQ